MPTFMPDNYDAPQSDIFIAFSKDDDVWMVPPHAVKPCEEYFTHTERVIIQSLTGDTIHIELLTYMPELLATDERNDAFYDLAEAVANDEYLFYGEGGLAVVVQHELLALWRAWEQEQEHGPPATYAEKCVGTEENTELARPIANPLFISSPPSKLWDIPAPWATTSRSDPHNYWNLNSTPISAHRPGLARSSPDSINPDWPPSWTAVDTGEAVLDALSFECDVAIARASKSLKGRNKRPSMTKMRKLYRATTPPRSAIPDVYSFERILPGCRSRRRWLHPGEIEDEDGWETVYDEFECDEFEDHKEDAMPRLEYDFAEGYSDDDDEDSAESSYDGDDESLVQGGLEDNDLEEEDVQAEVEDDSYLGDDESGNAIEDEQDDVEYEDMQKPDDEEPGHEEPANSTPSLVSLASSNLRLSWDDDSLSSLSRSQDERLTADSEDGCERRIINPEDDHICQPAEEAATKAQQTSTALSVELEQSLLVDDTHEERIIDPEDDHICQPAEEAATEAQQTSTAPSVELEQPFLVDDTHTSLCEASVVVAPEDDDISKSESSFCSTASSLPPALPPISITWAPVVVEPIVKSSSCEDELEALGEVTLLLEDILHALADIEQDNAANEPVPEPEEVKHEDREEAEVGDVRDASLVFDEELELEVAESEKASLVEVPSPTSIPEAPLPQVTVPEPEVLRIAIDVDKQISSREAIAQADAEAPERISSVPKAASEDDDRPPAHLPARQSLFAELMSRDFTRVLRPSARRTASPPSSQNALKAPSPKKQRGIAAIAGFTTTSRELLSRRSTLASVDRARKESRAESGFQLPKLRGTGRLLNGAWKSTADQNADFVYNSAPSSSPKKRKVLWGRGSQAEPSPSSATLNPVVTPSSSSPRKKLVAAGGAMWGSAKRVLGAKAPTIAEDANLALMLPKPVNAQFYVKKR
ncbi:hypothetical protein H0H81_001569 [Sphagnurus paluster]|uniref:Uncharacterized protein n=1 Tax=Sphagnurus paluster TaxID=117069 RepID=A0A9P7FME8_9AGAR|nr:hypothetical protein H0H81_001569 [Sphagnurus paluster]